MLQSSLVCRWGLKRLQGIRADADSDGLEVNVVKGICEFLLCLSIFSGFLKADSTKSSRRQLPRRLPKSLPRWLRGRSGKNIVKEIGRNP